ncbi:hypothetical protein [Blastopirellula marina]|uniref:Uncharacterized protein n=1 Tax=Blastopirellula marina TaxID=124 RepID=A0A2S8GP17_9BACT|nr:hypothetical protein [Blastopirellula marina]PQO46170.1 hypothetical protein C5Y93_09270 [Blastopirellula marina]
MNGGKYSKREPHPPESESSEFWERQWDEQERGMRVPAAMFLVVLVTLLVVAGRFSSPVLVSVLGIWLMIGRGNVLVRCLVTVSAVWILGRVSGSGDATAVLVACTALSAMTTSVAGAFVSHLFQGPTRWAQFSLWDMGSYLLAFGMGVALVREDMQALTSQNRVPWVGIFAIATLCVNIVVASLPVFVPKRYREGSLFLVSAALVLFVLPLLEGAFLHAFLFVPNLNLLAQLPIVHVIGAVLVWTLVFTLETAGGFVDDTRPRQEEERLEGTA